MENVILLHSGRRAMMEWAIAAGDHWQMFLFKNSHEVTLETELADLEECDFSGYDDVQINPGAITINGDDNAEVTFSLAQFTHNGGATANNVYGWYIVGDIEGLGKLIWAGNFLDAEGEITPRVMAVLDDQINLTFRDTYGQCPP